MTVVAPAAGCSVNPIRDPELFSTPPKIYNAVGPVSGRYVCCVFVSAAFRPVCVFCWFYCIVDGWVWPALCYMQLVSSV